MSAAATIWLTGLSGSGKTTLGSALCEALRARGERVVRIEGEEVRAALGGELGFSLRERELVLEAIVARAVAERAAGRTPVVATISHTRAMRAYARARLTPFLEVYLDCPASVCRARDPKGLYARAARGEAGSVVGVDLVYEPPECAELVLDTARLSVEESARLLLHATLALLARLRSLPSRPEEAEDEA